MKPIYLDNNATTQIDNAVLDAMLPYFHEVYGNPSSILNEYGNKASQAIQDAKRLMVTCFHALSENDFIFTSGATESNNLALKGIVSSTVKKTPHIITSQIEHESILEVCKQLEQEGASITYLPVDTDGIVKVSDVEKAVTENTILISIMSANNEIGTIQPIEEIGAIARQHHILFHTDATQYIGFQLIDVSKISVDMISFSGHKIYGPKGIGGLYANAQARLRLQPQMLGGGQQLGLRSGTLNVPGIVGMAKAVEFLRIHQAEDNKRILTFRNQLMTFLVTKVGAVINGDKERRLPNNLNFYIPGITALSFIAKFPELSVSTGSACSSKSGKDSHVLKAIGLDRIAIDQSIRLGLGKGLREGDVYTIIELLNERMCRNVSG